MKNLREGSFEALDKKDISMSAHKYLVHFSDQLWLPLLRPSSPTLIQAQELLSRTLSRLELCTFFLGDGVESTIKIRLLSKVVSK